MKKLLLACVVAASGIMAANAENYSFVALSYDNTQLWYGDNFGTKDGLSVIGHDSNSASLNGFGIQYTYGIGITKLPMNIEVGLKWNMGFDGTKINEEYQGVNLQEKINTQFMRLSIPVSYIYHWKATDLITIAPYAGFDFRFNLLAKTKDKLTTNVAGVAAAEQEMDWFNKDDMGDDTANRFQLAWHIGVRFEVSKLFLGLEYGTDMMPFWSAEYLTAKQHINTGNFSLNVGFKF